MHGGVLIACVGIYKIAVFSRNRLILNIGAHHAGSLGCAVSQEMMVYRGLFQKKIN